MVAGDGENSEGDGEEAEEDDETGDEGGVGSLLVAAGATPGVSAAVLAPSAGEVLGALPPPVCLRPHPVAHHVVVVVVVAVSLAGHRHRQQQLRPHDRPGVLI